MRDYNRFDICRNLMDCLFYYEGESDGPVKCENLMVDGLNLWGLDRLNGLFIASIVYLDQNVIIWPTTTELLFDMMICLTCIM